MDKQVRPRLEKYMKEIHKLKTEKKGNEGLTKKGKRKLQRKNRKLRKNLRLANKRIDVIDARCEDYDDKLTALTKEIRRRDVRDGLNRKLNRLAAEQRWHHHE